MAKAVVIVPVWNGEKVIEECLASILDQSNRSFDCVVVNDGSTDATMDIVDRVIKGDGRFKVVQQEHQGLSVARNAGIAASDADIILHLDADDLAKPDLVGHVEDFILSNDLDMAIYDAVPENKGISEFRFGGEQRYFFRRKAYGFGTGKELLKRMLDGNDYVYSTFLHSVRRKSIVADFCPRVRAQDQLHTTQCYLMMEKVGHLPETLIVKRCWPDSVAYSPRGLHYAWSKMKCAFELASFADRNSIEEPEIVNPILDKMFTRMTECFSLRKEPDWDFLNTLSFFDRTMLMEMRNLWIHGRRFHTFNQGRAS